MGLGNRADTLEDKIDHHNHQKNLAQGRSPVARRLVNDSLRFILGDALRRKLIVAVAERARQVDAFREVSATISKELRNHWTAMIDAFVKDHDEPNPYALSPSGNVVIHLLESPTKRHPDRPTEAETRLALKADEEAEARKGNTPVHGTSVTAFLVAGLQLEDAQ
jgi:DNA-binding cell septation regulator SpoVG